MEISYQKMYQIDKLKAREMIVETYQKTGSVKMTAKLWKTSRNVVRKWITRYKVEGKDGLRDRTRRPVVSPNKTPKDVEEKVIEAREKTGYGKRRLCWYLFKEVGIEISENTVRNILKRNGLTKKVKKRKIFYPAIWVYDRERAFSLAQVDTKDIYDKRTLGTRICTHLSKTNLPRYQWTFCEGKTRIRFLGYSYRLNQTNGLAFVILVMSWIRGFGIKGEVIWQEDWGQEFGGDNPDKLEKLDRIYYRPFGARLMKAPKGRKTYQGRVERSHRTDDEEFYIPNLLNINNEEEFLRIAGSWVFWYNTGRPHFGDKMDGKTPYQKLKEEGYDVPEEFCAFPPVILDRISTGCVLNFSLKGGNDLLAPYIL